MKPAFAMRFRIFKIFRIGFCMESADQVQSGEQGRFQRLFWCIYWLEAPINVAGLRRNLKEAGKQIVSLQRIGQQQADLHFLCLEYMKRHGINRKKSATWLAGKEAHKILVDEYTRRAKAGKVG